VIPITGRPAGWCDHIARMWPVDAVVGENGALYMRYDRTARRLVARFRGARSASGARTGHGSPRSARKFSRRFPVARSRPISCTGEADIAIDFREDVAPLPRAAVDRIVALMEARGSPPR